MPGIPAGLTDSIGTLQAAMKSAAEFGAWAMGNPVQTGLALCIIAGTWAFTKGQPS
jgi:hypothetical protein